MILFKMKWLIAFLTFSCLTLLTAKAVLATDPVLELSQDQWVGAKKEIELSTGIKALYVEMGQPEATPIVFLHGMTDNSRSWSLIASYFAGQYRLIIPDLRGHGGSDKPDLRSYPVSLYASDIAALIEALGLEKAHVVGHSLGSFIAQELAINYPEKVSKVVLESSALVHFESLGKDIYLAAVGFGENPPDDAFMEAWYTNPNPVNEEFLKLEMAESKGLPPHAWRAITKGAAESYLLPFMDELKAPTLILWGAADGFFGAEAQAALKAALPGAKSVDYPNIGHNIQWEIPEQMAKDVLAFLTE
ncbi:MAG: alpha/beta hydrolase [Deltaproteobacteria bacterium]|nr:alpha/beta hydrolase [Deltaproteobacteria bacterium]